MRCLHLKPEDFIFLGEGNDHIVFDLANTGCVLRIRKSPLNSNLSKIHFLKEATKDKDLMEYCRIVLGKAVVDASLLAIVNSQLLDKVMKLVNHTREDKRKHKIPNIYGIGILCPNAVTSFEDRPLFRELNNGIVNIIEEKISRDDSAVISVEKCSENYGNQLNKICVEIKPKQGYLEQGSKYYLCRFCMKQFYKVESGDQKIISQYCPLDLFSGDSSRIEKAVENLFTTPQDNLRVFLNGQFQHDLVDYKYLRNLIIGTLRVDQRSTKHQSKESIHNCHDKQMARPPLSVIKSNVSSIQSVNNQRHPKFLQEAQKPVQRNSILEDLLNIQIKNYLNTIDAASLYQRLQEQIPEAAMDDILSAYFHECVNSEVKISDDVSLTLPEDVLIDYTINKEQIQGIQTLCQKLLCMSLRDVSIMILMEGPHARPKESQNKSIFWIKRDIEDWYMCRVRLVDLTWKNPQKLMTHETAIHKYESYIKELFSRGNAPSCCKRMEISKTLS